MTNYATLLHFCCNWCMLHILGVRKSKVKIGKIDVHLHVQVYNATPKDQDFNDGGKFFFWHVNFFLDELAPAPSLLPHFQKQCYVPARKVWTNFFKNNKNSSLID